MHDRVVAQHRAVLKCEETIVSPSGNYANRSRLPTRPNGNRSSNASGQWNSSKVECGNASNHRRGSERHVYGHDESKEVSETCCEVERQWSWNVQLFSGATQDPDDPARYRIVQDEDDDTFCDVYRKFTLTEPDDLTCIKPWESATALRVAPL